MSTLTVSHKSLRTEKTTVANWRSRLQLQDVVASISLVALSTTVLTLVYELLVP
jgi:hypothetical protein